MNSTPQPQATTTRPTHEQIAALAYQFWEKGGHRPGHDLEYWLRAEKQLSSPSQPKPVTSVTSAPGQPSSIEPRQSSTLGAPRPTNGPARTHRVHH